MTATKASEATGRRLLTAVERIVAAPDDLVEKVHALGEDVPEDAEDPRAAAAERIVRHFANRSAMSGGATSLPAIVPGLGTLVAMVGGTLVDMALMLKFEVEMAMCLTHLYGHDIREARERQFAYLLASVSTYEASGDTSLLGDLARAEGTAIWNYTPREYGKFIIKVFAILAVIRLAPGAIKALPFVGIAVSAGMNGALTRRVGAKCIRELELRDRIDAAA